MRNWNLKDFIRGERESQRINYTGGFDPKEFWVEMGEIYRTTFTQQDDDKHMASIKLNLPGLLGRLIVIKPKSILEVGCGFGRALPFIHRNVPGLERIVGIDFSPTMVKESWQHLAKYPDRDKIEIKQADATDLPFKDGEFDCIYTHVCLTHIPPKHIPTVTKEISRVAKNWIIHIERFKFLYEHPHHHRWSHLLAPHYLELGWQIHDCDTINDEHYTNILVLRR